MNFKKGILIFSAVVLLASPLFFTHAATGDMVTYSGLSDNYDFASDGVNTWTVTPYIGPDPFKGIDFPSVMKISPDGATTTYPVPGAEGIAFDNLGNAWVGANYFYSSPNGYGPYSVSVAKITPTGVVTTYQNSSYYTTGTTMRPRGGIVFDGVNMWMGVQFSGLNATTGSSLWWSVVKISPQGVMTKYDVSPVTNTSSGGSAPFYKIVFGGGNIWAVGTDSTWAGTAFVKKISPAGVVTTYSGITSPRDVAVDSEGNAWVSSSLSVKKISTAGAITSYPLTFSPRNISFDGANIWAANPFATSLAKILPTTGAITPYTVGGATNITLDNDGNAWTVSSGGSVKKISPAGFVTTYTGTGAGPSKILFDGEYMWTMNADSVTKIDARDLSDLVASAVIPITGLTGSPIVLSSIITNNGSRVATTSFSSSFQFAQNDQGLNPGPIQVGSSIDEVAPGATAVTTYSTTFTTAGTYYVSACADYSSVSTSGLVTEFNEDNNCSPWTQVVVSDPLYSDLTTTFIPPVGIVAESPVVLSANVTNSGTLDITKTFPNSFWVATGSNGEGVGPLMTGSPITGLLKNLTQATTNNTWIPSAPGLYYVSVCADETTPLTGVVTESNELNNCTPWTMVTVIPKQYSCPVCLAGKAYSVTTGDCEFIKCPAGRVWNGAQCN